MMALFGKKKEEVKDAPSCCCGGAEEVKSETAGCCGGSEKVKSETAACCGGSEEVKAETAACCGENIDGVCCVKVLGAGCKSCHEQYENAKKAVENLGLNVEVEYITDMEKIMSYGVMSMPALLVNDKIVSVGKVLKPKEVEKFLQ